MGGEGDAVRCTIVHSAANVHLPMSGVAPWSALEGDEQVELIGLADEIDSEAVVRFLLGKNEATVEVDVPRGDERIVGPQDHPGVARRAGEVQAGVDESAAESVAARLRVDQQQAQLRRGSPGLVAFAGVDAEDASSS